MTQPQQGLLTGVDGEKKAEYTRQECDIIIYCMFFWELVRALSPVLTTLGCLTLQQTRRIFGEQSKPELPNWWKNIH